MLPNTLDQNVHILLASLSRGGDMNKLSFAGKHRAIVAQKIHFSCDLLSAQRAKNTNSHFFPFYPFGVNHIGEV
jgi:hypothetical protein